MSGFEIAIGIVLIILSLIIIAVVLLQEGRQANLGAIQGAADSFLDKGKARTLDAMLARWTKYIAIAFFVLVLAGTVMVLDTVLDLVGGSWFVGRIQPDQFSWAWFSGSGLALRAIIIFVTLLAAAQEYVSTLIADTLKG